MPCFAGAHRSSAPFELILKKGRWKGGAKRKRGKRVEEEGGELVIEM